MHGLDRETDIVRGSWLRGVKAWVTLTDWEASTLLSSVSTKSTKSTSTELIIAKLIVTRSSWASAPFCVITLLLFAIALRVAWLLAVEAKVLGHTLISRDYTAGVELHWITEVLSLGRLGVGLRGEAFVLTKVVLVMCFELEVLGCLSVKPAPFIIVLSIRAFGGL